jgi:phosphoenolpyruvate carboxykinase (ATP)
MITAALEGRLEKVEYQPHPVFGLMMPSSCTDVPASLLNPEATWKNKALYVQQAKKLAEAFVSNFTQYSERVSPEIISAGPVLNKKQSK